MKITELTGREVKTKTVAEMKQEIVDTYGDPDDPDDNVDERFNKRIPMPAGTKIIDCQRGDTIGSGTTEDPYQLIIEADTIIVFEEDGYVMSDYDDDGLTTDQTLIAVEGDTAYMFSGEPIDITADGDTYGDPCEPNSLAKVKAMNPTYILLSN